MRYAVVDHEGNILKVGSCREEDMAAQGDIVISAPSDVDDSSHTWNGTTFVRKPIQAPSNEVIRAKTMIEMRKIRNGELRDTDWTQMPDAPISEQERAAWTIYRQQLRDMPQNHPSAVVIEDITWPTKPN